MTLEDYEMPQKSTMHSSKHLSLGVYQEFKIKEAKLMLFHLSFYSGNMGEGRVVFSAEVERGWMPIAKDSVNYYLWESLAAPYRGK